MRGTIKLTDATGRLAPDCRNIISSYKLFPEVDADRERDQAKLFASHEADAFRSRNGADWKRSRVLDLLNAKRASMSSQITTCALTTLALNGLENYFMPGDLEAHIDAFVGHYNHQHFHESLNNLTPADVYTGRGHTILLEREKTKRRTMKLRRLQHAKSAA